MLPRPVLSLSKGGRCGCSIPHPSAIRQPFDCPFSVLRAGPLAIGTTEALKCAEDTEQRASASSVPSVASVVPRPRKRKATEGVAFSRWLQGSQRLSGSTRLRDSPGLGGRVRKARSDTGNMVDITEVPRPDGYQKNCCR